MKVAQKHFSQLPEGLLRSSACLKFLLAYNLKKMHNFRTSNRSRHKKIKLFKRFNLKRVIQFNESLQSVKVMTPFQFSPTSAL